MKQRLNNIDRIPWFRPFWIIRTLWLLLLLAVGWWMSRGEAPLIFSFGVSVALVIQLLLLGLWTAGRLPPRHDWISALAAATSCTLAAWLFPELLFALLLLSTVPLLDLARWRGSRAFLFLFLFPVPLLADFYIRDLFPLDNLPLLTTWALVTLFGMALASFQTRSVIVEVKPVRQSEEASAQNILIKVAHLLVQESKYQRILDVLVRSGCELLDGRGRRSRSKAMALTFKPGLRDVLTVVAEYNMEQRLVEQSYELEGVLHLLLKEGDPIDTTADNPPFDQMRALQDHRILLFPLRTSLDVYGAVMFATRDSERAVDEHVQRTLIALADQTSLALHNAVLQQQLLQDWNERLGGEGDARHQLARDLHDGPVQRVAAITMQLELLKALVKRQPEKALAEVEQLEEVAKQASQEMRTMLFSLRPVVLESEGLAAALETFIQRLRDQDGLEIHFEAQRLPRLGEKVEEVTFAILQEAINNAKKYASDAPINVRLLKGQDMVIGQVEDHGPGFDLKSVTASYGTRASLGLLNMRERAEMVGGVLKIDTAPGHGTTISLAVPHELG